MACRDVMLRGAALHCGDESVRNVEPHVSECTVTESTRNSEVHRESHRSRPLGKSREFTTIRGSPVSVFAFTNCILTIHSE